MQIFVSTANIIVDLNETEGRRTETEQIFALSDRHILHRMRSQIFSIILGLFWENGIYEKMLSKLFPTS